MLRSICEAFLDNFVAVSVSSFTDDYELEAILAGVAVTRCLSSIAKWIAFVVVDFIDLEDVSAFNAVLVLI